MESSEIAWSVGEVRARRVLPPGVPTSDAAIDYAIDAVSPASPEREQGKEGRGEERQDEKEANSVPEAAGKHAERHGGEHGKRNCRDSHRGSRKPGGQGQPEELVGRPSPDAQGAWESAIEPGGSQIFGEDQHHFQSMAASQILGIEAEEKGVNQAA